ncbi:efflux RND transporter permease subunit, partial [Chlamydiota bacterium]
LITVFIPLIFMAGVVGRNFREFALTVVFAIICSTFLALTLSPMMCARVLKSAKKEVKTRLEKFTDGLIGNIVKKYGIALKWFLEHKILSVVSWLLCILGTVLLFSIIPQAFMPPGDSGAIMGQIVMQQGTSTAQMRDFQDKVNDTFMNDPNVERVLTVTGLQPGADQTTGILYVTLKPLKKRKPIDQVIHDFDKKFAVFPEGFVFIQPIPVTMLSAGGESTALGSTYSYVITGEDREKVYSSAQKLENKLKASPDFTAIQSSVKLDMPQLKVNILRDKASSLGLSAQDIEHALLLAFAGGKVTTYKTDVDQYDVILELEKNYQRRPEDLSSLYITSPQTGMMVPLGAVAEWEKTVGPQNVPHSNQLNSATISFNLAPGVPLGNATQELNTIVNEILPPEVFGNFQGEAEEFQEATGSLILLLLIAVFIMYVILGILYESYIHPFTILTTLPVAAFGGFLTLLVFRSELSLYAYIGTFMLLGIVSKNGIMMVDFAKQNMEEGKNSFDAIYDACLVRFRPILMTGLSTIMGAMPIALGFGADGSSRRPLGLIIVGGLAFAQVITLFVTPGIFLYMQKFQEKYLDRFELTRSISAKKTEK